MAEQRICSVDACDKPHNAKGLCSAHYQRLRKHGDPLAGRTPEGEPKRFYQEVVLNYDGDECLIWPFARTTKGYGQIVVDGRLRLVHRVACEEVNGAPPTPDLEAAHSCGKGHFGCVTKGHLSWKTPKENNADKMTHGTHSRGERHNMAKLTEDNVREIMALKGVEPQRSIADRYSVAHQTIADIHRGKNWSWLSFQLMGG